MKFHLSLSLFLSLAIFSNAQDSLSDIVNQRVIGDPLEGLFGINSFQKDADGGYIFIGANMMSHGFYYDDILVTKLDSDYNIKWQRTFGSTGEDSPGSIIPALGGGYVLTCRIGGTGRDFPVADSSFGMWMMRLGPGGDEVWRKKIKGPATTPVLVSDSSEAYYLGSASYDESFGVHRKDSGRVYLDVLVQKMDTAGNLLWGHCFGGVLAEGISTLKLTSDGGVVSIGSTYGDHLNQYGEQYNQDIWVIKVSKTGGLQWQRSLGTEMFDNGIGVRELEDGDYLVTGGVRGDTRFVPTEGYLARISKMGELLWEHVAAGTHVDEFADAVVTGDGGILAVGYTESPERKGFRKENDAWVYRLDRQRNLVSERCYGGRYEDRAYTITPLTNGDYLIYGVTMSPDGDVKGKSNGSVDAWLFEISGSQKSSPGNSLPPLLNGSIRLRDPNLPRRVISIYPNPFRGRVTIEGLQNDKQYEVILFNALGQRIVRRLISHQSKEELHIPSGEKVIFLQITDRSKKRMIGTVKLLAR